MKLKGFISIFVIMLIVTGIGFAITNLISFKKIYEERKITEEKINKELAEYIRVFPGELGVYIKDLRTGAEVMYNENKLFPSASLVKIPIMAAVYKAINDGILTANDKIQLKREHKVRGCGIYKRQRSGTSYEVDDVVKHMIEESDNTATNMLTDRLGFNYLNWCFKQFGLRQTNLERAIMDLRARDYYGIGNYTTAREMGLLFEEIYYGRLINEDISKKMLTILSQQKINDRIPKYLPKNYIIAHKTGLMKDACHDAGIVFTDKTDFIIIILTSDFSTYRSAKRVISNIAYSIVNSL